MSERYPRPVLVGLDAAPLPVPEHGPRGAFTPPGTGKCWRQPRSTSLPRPTPCREQIQ